MVHGPLHEIDDAEMNLGRDLPRVAMSFNVRQDNYHTRLRSINFLPRNYSAVKSSNLLSLVSILTQNVTPEPSHFERRIIIALTRT